MSELHKIALKIIGNGKGILAADESTGTMTKDLKALKWNLHLRIDYYLEKLFLHLLEWKIV